MLELACTFQVLRTMNRQSVAYLNKRNNAEFSKPLLLAIVAPNCTDASLKRISQMSLKSIQLVIHTAIEENALEQGLDQAKLKDVHTTYGDRLFLRLAKRIQFVIPQKGSPERFVLDKSILTFLVVTTLRPGSKISFDSFLYQLKIRYGLVFDYEGFNEIIKGSPSPQQVLEDSPEIWLTKMLEECGFLIQLADSLSLVTNNAGLGEEV
jgi:hypothetical protein